MNATAAKTFAKHALQVVHKSHLGTEEVEALTVETLRYWREHINPSFLTYRKTMGDGDAYAALDWCDRHPGTAWFEDATGQLYLDCLSGFGIFNVGHRHPEVVRAVSAQLSKQALHSQELLDPLRALGAKILVSIMPSPTLDHVFFVNSGTEAVEAALKMALLATGRKRIVSFINAFHGKTLGSLAVTSKAAFRAPFVGSLMSVSHCQLNDIDALYALFAHSAATGDLIAALIVEPIQGEGGVNVASSDFLRACRCVCDTYGACLIFDEVQCGFGRTGRWWASEHTGVIPDLMCIGKSAGGGVMPVGACLGTAAVWARYIDNPFLFTSTFGGNPLSMAAMIAAVNVVFDDDLLGRATLRGKQLKDGLCKIAVGFPDLIKEVRGVGLMVGVEFMSNAIGIAWSRTLFRRRILVSGTLVSATTIRVCPPLVISETEIAYALSEMESACADVRQQQTSCNAVQARL